MENKTVIKKWGLFARVTLDLSQGAIQSEEFPEVFTLQVSFDQEWEAIQAAQEWAKSNEVVFVQSFYTCG